jgi:hypothetical protein
VHAKSEDHFPHLRDARSKLFEEMSHYRGDKPPMGAFISKLIFDVPRKAMEEGTG